MPSDRPSTAELIEAVREYLERELQPTLEGSQAFHTRVAVNVLRIVERELATGAALDEAERERLVRFLGREGTLEELCEALVEGIRDGRFDIDSPGLLEHLRATVMGKLSVDNPRYKSYQRAIERDR